jgi:hypothetical protein
MSRALHKKSKIMCAPKHRVTLKAFALKPSVVVFLLTQSTTEAQSSQRLHRDLTLFRQLRLREMSCVVPGLLKRNATTPCGLPARGPRSWAGIGERFQRYSFSVAFSKMGSRSTYCAKAVGSQP